MKNLLSSLLFVALFIPNLVYAYSFPPRLSYMNDFQSGCYDSLAGLVSSVDAAPTIQDVSTLFADNNLCHEPLVFVASANNAWLYSCESGILLNVFDARTGDTINTTQGVYQYAYKYQYDNVGGYVPFVIIIDGNVYYTVGYCEVAHRHYSIAVIPFDDAF